MLKLKRADLIILVGLFLVAVGLGWWARHEMLPKGRWPSGDEPNYAIMTESLIEDGDFDIKNNFQSKKYINRFYGEELEPHINHRYFQNSSRHWYSVHSFGLPLLIAPLAWMAPFFHLSQ